MSFSWNKVHSSGLCIKSILFHRSRQSLKVREHKVLGPYVDGLSQLAVTNFEVNQNP